MESKDELKEIDIKNCRYYYSDDIMRVIDIDLSNMLLNEKSYKTYENILIYDISYRTFMGSKPLRIRLKQIDLSKSEADSELVKLVGMTNVFFNNQRHEIKTKQFISVKQIKFSFFSNNGNQHFYS